MKPRHHKKAIVSILFLSFIAVFYFISGTAQTSSEKEIVFVERDTDSKTILETLQEKGFIKNRLTYHTISALSNFVESIEPGGYVLPKNLNAVAIHAALSEPAYKYVAVIEGMRKEEIAERFGNALDWEEEKIQEFKGKYPVCSFSGREGFMAPGDYLVSGDATIQSIQSEMEARFKEKIDELTEKEKESIFDLNQVVTIASLIQREAAGKRDMRLISGVIWNRILVGMPLQIDATLQYVKGDDELWWPRVNSEDKFLDSPYNTYQTEGLPPGPIANPGRAALEAALNPSETNCIFYLHDANRNIHCATTYDGHLDNIKRYLK